MESVDCRNCKFCEREMESDEEDYFFWHCKYMEGYGISTGINIEHYKKCKFFKPQKYVKQKAKDSVGD